MMGMTLTSFFPAVHQKLKDLRAECSFQDCPSKQLVRIIPGYRPGIRVGNGWYCGVDCFAAAMCTHLSELSSRRVVEIRRTPRLSLGLELLAKGSITASQLRAATAESQWLGEELETTLIRLGLTSEKKIAAARSAQWGYPVLAQEHVGHIVETDIPRSLLRACGAVPFHHSIAARRVILGFTARVDHRLLEAIEFMTGSRAEPCFVTATDFEDQMERVASLRNCEEVVLDDPGTSGKMARIIGRMSVKISAREASYTQCGDRVWVRLSGPREKMDVIFRTVSASGTPMAQQGSEREESLVELR